MMEAVQPRVVGLIAVLSLASGWLVSTVVSQNSPPVPVRAFRVVLVRLVRKARWHRSRSNFDSSSRNIRDRRSPGRNPFVFGARRPAARRSADCADGRTATPGVEACRLAPIVPHLRFDLSGIAMSRLDGAEVFTAIVNDNGTLAFVKAGDALSNGYSVSSASKRRP